MAVKPLTMNPNYLAIVHGIRELHRLCAAGTDESPEADSVRDACDRPWESLSETERQRVGNLSEDLYSLVEPPPAVQPMNPQSQAKLNEAYEARQRGDWDRALDLLRRWRAYVDPALVSYLRGAIWREAGDIETAVLFFEHAAKLRPENGNYLAIFLHTLDIVNPGAAQGRAEMVLHVPENSPPLVIARAAEIVFRSSLRLAAPDARFLFGRLISVLQETLQRIQIGDESGVDRSTYAMTVALVGACHQFLGEMQPALRCYSEGLSVDPDNDALLTARGMLLYGTDPSADADLKLAIELGSPLIWPYFFSAHHRLLNRRYEECRMLCERAIAMPAPNSAKSELHEWLAISQAELGFPVEIVRKTLETAIRLDPGNDRAQHNLSVFEAAVGPVVNNWTTRSAAAVRSSVLAEWPYATVA